MTTRLAHTPHPLPTLEVLEGQHQGVNLVLAEATYVIGSDTADALVLGDAGVVAHHLTVRLHGHQVSVEACGARASVETRGQVRTLDHGTGYRATLPVVIQLGEARVRLNAPAGAPAALRGSRRRSKALLAVAFMGMCAGAMAMLQSASPRPEGAAGPAAAPLPTTAQPTLEQARQALAQQVASAGLQGLSVARQAQGLRVAGTLAPEQLKAWQAVQRYYDAHYARQFVLHSEVQVRPPVQPPVLNLQAAWFGPNPYLIAQSGEKLQPGAVLAGGWRIERIADERIQLVHGGERFELLFGAPAH